MDYEKKYKEAQKWIESIYSELSHEQQMEAEAFFPELKESEDEKMMHQLHSWMKEFGGAEEYTEKVYTWLKSLLEKQGEQKPNPCDGCINRKGCINCENGELREAEQKPADKVGTKFKVGDWITTTDEEGNVTTEKIIEFWGDKVRLIDTNGFYSLWPKHELNYYHIWTINDAKDGDVLACPLPKGCESGEQIFIFKGINSRDYVDNCIEYYCRICEGVFYVNENGYMGTTSSPLYPATKEQRNLLFQKIKDAGYKWDEGKKELRKIEQKPQRMISAEAKEAMYDKPTDNDMVEALRTEYEKGKADAFTEMEKSWSEEDKNFMYDTLSNLTELKDRYGKDYGNVGKCMDWLKSLKQRIGG